MIKKSLLNKVIEGCFNEIYIIDAATSTYSKVNQMAQDRLGYTFLELQQMRPWQLARDFTQLEWQRQMEPLLSGQQQKNKYHDKENPRTAHQGGGMLQNGRIAS